MLSLTRDVEENKLYNQRDVAKRPEEEDGNAPMPTGGGSRYLVIT